MYIFPYIVLFTTGVYDLVVVLKKNTYMYIVLSI